MPAKHDAPPADLRWRQLLTMAADLAFEADQWSRFVFLTPDSILGWPAQALIGKPAELLLAAPGSVAGFNPFRVSEPVRRRRAWLNRAGGGHACLRFTCTPLLDAAGLPSGTRGIATLETPAEASAVAGPAIDTLTGLLNRPAFLDELGRRLGRLDRTAAPGTLICANLDRFQALNEALGPVLGDRVLAKIAGLLSATLRPEDLIGRLGSDAFAMWMGGADHMTAAERAEALRLAVPEAVAEIAGPDAPLVGISIGIAARHHGGGETVDMLLRRAEMAVKAVKHGGRGHWRVAHVTDP